MKRVVAEFYRLDLWLGALLVDALDQPEPQYLIPRTAAQVLMILLELVNDACCC